jgi:Enoyl-CoA hydratase/isomerase
MTASLLASRRLAAKSPLRRLAINPSALCVQHAKSRLLSSLPAAATRLTAVLTAEELKAIEQGRAPPAIAAVPNAIDPGKAGAAIGAVGCTRRVYLRRPHLTSVETQGLAHRVQALLHNTGLNSVFMGPSMQEDDPDGESAGILPIMCVRDTQREAWKDILRMEDYPPAAGKTFFVAGGYDALTYANAKPDEIDYLLDSWVALHKTLNDFQSKIPSIALPHGALHNAGLVWLQASYAIATPETCALLDNTSRGLTFDPVGLSFLLPRMGQEFRQPSAKYPACGPIFALCGHFANAQDLFHTGLATHHVRSLRQLSSFEQTLMELPPWDQQALIKNPKRYYGDDSNANFDHQALFRNRAVADAVFRFADARADGTNLQDEAEIKSTDPSLDIHRDVMAEREIVESSVSDLVNRAKMFDGLFRKHAHSLTDLYDALDEVSQRTTTDEWEQEKIDVAKEWIEHMKVQSPLALRVTHRLLQLGSRSGETRTSCVNRERIAQGKMLQGKDFQAWCVNVQSGGVPAWQHAGIKDVSDQEVADVIEV